MPSPVFALVEYSLWLYLVLDSIFSALYQTLDQHLSCRDQCLQTASFEKGWEKGRNYDFFSPWTVKAQQLSTAGEGGSSSILYQQGRCSAAPGDKMGGEGCFWMHRCTFTLPLQDSQCKALEPGGLMHLG